MRTSFYFRREYNLLNSNDAFEYKDKGFKALLTALGESSPTAKVGILGSGKARTEQVPGKNKKVPSKLSNAEIGIIHEFGDAQMPMRSFLRMPISTRMQTFLDKTRLFTPAVIKQVMADKSLEKIISILGIIGESLVLEAFSSGGFGQWKKSIMENKKNKETLVETQQLRNSISSEVS